METVFWWFLIGGAMFTLVSVLIGDIIGSLLDGAFDLPGMDWLSPVVITGSATTFGGAGILLSKYTGLGHTSIVALSLLIAAAMAVLVFLTFVKPMANSEVSNGYSMQELTGKIGEVTIPVPEAGYGEVMIKMGAGNIIHIASSFDQCLLSAGTRIVVIEVAEGVLRVSQLDT